MQGIEGDGANIYRRKLKKKMKRKIYMDKALVLEEVEKFYNTYGPGASDFYVSHYEVCETKLEKDAIVLKLISPYFRIKSQMSEEEWQKKIVTPVSDTIFCLEEEGITWERYHKYLENCDREEEEDNKKTRAEKIKEQRKARQGEKVRFKKWLKEIKKDFAGNTDYMKEGFERGKSAEEEYTKFQIKIINSLTNNSYFKEDRLFWNGFRKGLVARKKPEAD